MGQQVIGLMYGAKATKSFGRMNQDDDGIFDRPGWEWTEAGEMGFMVASAMPEHGQAALDGSLLSQLATCRQAKQAQKRWEKLVAYMREKHPRVKLGKAELRFVFHDVA